ncbi:MAG: class II aldolase/adducin family protein [Acidobacteria bacterium]|jgi:ribulose-5-phosphate 4-epimerase/fuculose-1-phosphate aldolase|nr:class II aldolase/adducin family protein [Acidobacteriota bacterium]
MQTEIESLCEAAASFHARGYAFGSTGNLSVSDGTRVWISPTGASLRKLTPEKMAEIDMEGVALNGNKASKEYPFHLAAYRNSFSGARALVHLHSTWAVALSCLADLDEAAPMPVFTPYYLMRVAPLAVIPYLRPGSAELAEAVGEAARGHDCVLMRNHGFLTLGKTMDEAVDRAEELEETAKLFFLLRNEKLRLLTTTERAEIERVYGRK